jgi:hypothetical protein
MSKFLLIPVFLLCFAACKHDEILPPEPELEEPLFYPGEREFGFASGVKDNRRFEASAYARFHNNHAYVAVDMETFSIEGYLREQVHFNEIPIKTGVHFIKNKANKYNDGFVGAIYSEWDDDALLAGYHSDTLSGNFVIVEKIDTLSRHVEGRVNVGFFQIGNSPFPPKTALKNVAFKAKIIE